MTDLVESLIDASLLVVLVVPALYYFQVRPMRRHLRERHELEARMAAADRALYDAKHEGRDRVVAAFAANGSQEGSTASVNR